jgi:hypothetical protein
MHGAFRLPAHNGFEISQRVIAIADRSTRVKRVIFDTTFTFAGFPTKLFGESG